jgi:hypothetical protein
VDAIKDIVTGLMQGLRDKKPAQDDPEAVLKKILSKKDLGHVKFRYLRRGILGIAVDSSTRLYQMNLQKPHLLAKLGKKSPGIKDIRLYLGEIS